MFIGIAFAITVIGMFFTLYGLESGIDYDESTMLIQNESYNEPSFSVLKGLGEIKNIKTGNTFIDSGILQFLGIITVLGILYYLRNGN